MALPEKRPPKSMTSRTLVRFCPSIWNVHIHVVGLVQVGARRRVDLKSGIDAPARKVNSIDHLLAVFGEGLLFRTLEIEGQAGVILNSTCDPEAWRDLVTQASANRVALVLRIRKMAAGK
jgi:hypothetical protein